MFNSQMTDEDIDYVRELCRRYKAEIKNLNECLREKNLQLDAAYHVWCSGGCHTGILRWQEDHGAPPLTEDIVKEAETEEPV